MAESLSHSGRTRLHFPPLERAMQAIAVRPDPHDDGAPHSRGVRPMIFDEGSFPAELERFVEDLGIADNVKMPGEVANPLKYFTQAQAFALTSYVEGMPNALVEAMMCGCTPVATNCPTGPRELLDDGKFGYLVSVGDPISIASGIEQALEKPIDKHLLAKAIAPFEEQTVIARHFELLGLADHGRKLSHADDQSQS